MAEAEEAKTTAPQQPHLSSGTRVVVCGGGVIGAATAYYLATHYGVSATVLERHEVAGAASGKAGGFLAFDWCEGTTIDALARKSFELHAELGAKFGEGYGYRRLSTSQVVVSKKPRKPKGEGPCPPWLDEKHVAMASEIGTPKTTAQLHPRLFTNWLLDEAKARGAKVVSGEVIGIQQNSEKEQRFLVTYKAGDKQRSKEIEADHVVIACGPWSSLSSKWMKGLEVPTISGTRAHSIVMQTKHPVAAHAAFIEFNDKAMRIQPEVYPRPDGTVYMCGSTDREPLPENPSEVSASQEACQTLVHAFQSFSESFKEADPVAQQACYLPYSKDNIPSIGQTNIEGIYFAAGHSFWGILCAPATGLALSELIVEGKASVVDLSPFDPMRFNRYQPK